jgi:hypothetical protein
VTPPSYHPLHLAALPGYPVSLAAVCAKLAHYRARDGIAWPARVEAWLSNFDGPSDQLAALSMLEKLCVVTPSDVVTACQTLLRRLTTQPGGPWHLFHAAEKPSGQELLNILLKQAGARAYQVLETSLFAQPSQLARRLSKPGACVVIWDTFNGTGKQLKTARKKYARLLTGVTPNPPSLYFAFVAGHPEAPPPPGPTQVVIWKDDFYHASESEHDVCDRYAPAAGATKTNRSYETGALITLPDNPPNNVPLILRAKASATWHPLLDRRDTPSP